MTHGAHMTQVSRARLLRHSLSTWTRLAASVDGTEGRFGLSLCRCAFSAYNRKGTARIYVRRDSLGGGCGEHCWCALQSQRPPCPHLTDVVPTLVRCASVPSNRGGTRWFDCLVMERLWHTIFGEPHVSKLS